MYFKINKFLLLCKFHIAENDQSQLRFDNDQFQDENLPEKGNKLNPFHRVDSQSDNIANFYPLI